MIKWNCMRQWFVNVFKTLYGDEIIVILIPVSFRKATSPITPGVVGLLHRFESKMNNLTWSEEERQSRFRVSFPVFQLSHQPPVLPRCPALSCRGAWPRAWLLPSSQLLIPWITTPHSGAWCGIWGGSKIWTELFGDWGAQVVHAGTHHLLYPDLWVRYVVCSLCHQQTGVFSISKDRKNLLESKEVHYTTPPAAPRFYFSSSVLTSFSHPLLSWRTVSWQRGHRTERLVRVQVPLGKRKRKSIWNRRTNHKH